MYARHAGFLPDVAAFDAAAFRRAHHQESLQALPSRAQAASAFAVGRLPEEEACRKWTEGAWQAVDGRRPAHPWLGRA